MGKVTSDSISSRSMPGASAGIVTVGAAEIRQHVQRNTSRRPAAPDEERSGGATTIGRCLGDQRMSPSIMFSSAQCTCPCAGTEVDNDASRTSARLSSPRDRQA